MLKRKKREAAEEGGVLYIGPVSLCLFTGDSAIKTKAQKLKPPNR